jgi:hypothetical protein
LRLEEEQQERQREELGVYGDPFAGLPVRAMLGLRLLVSRRL